MYCPQCGGTNEDNARFCTTCGLDMENYRKRWQQPGPGDADPQSQQPEPYQQPYGQPPAQQPYGAPPYQSQYQQPYQPQNAYQAPGYRPPYQPLANIPSYLGWAIAVLVISTISGNLIALGAGIVAVVYSSQVSNKLALGDYAGAFHSSKRAKLWSWISFLVMIAAIVIGIIVIVIAVASSTTIY